MSARRPGATDLVLVSVGGAAGALPRVDLAFSMMPEAGPILVTMTEMFDVADAFCRAERLLSMARTPAQRALQNWLLTEVVQQLGGASAQPWNPQAHTKPSTSQVG